MASAAVVGPPENRRARRQFGYHIRTVKAEPVERRIGQQNDPRVRKAQESDQQYQ
jgi:hypothetical protein